MFIPLDEAFPSHRKTLRFCGLMQDHNAFAYLIRLWTWAARSAPDGELTGLASSDIEMAIQYRQGDGRCYGAMVSAGFIEEEAPGCPARIHNWMERTGASIKRMEERAEYERERKANFRKNRKTTSDVPRMSLGTTQGHDDHAAGDVPGGVWGQDAIVQSMSEPRQGQARQDKEDPDLSLSPSPPRRPDPDRTGTRSNLNAGLSPFSAPRPARTVIPVGVKTEAFKAVFERYPRKDGEMKAAVVFADLAASTPGGEAALAKEILAAFEGGMLKRHPYAGINATRPMLETVLAEHRWRDPPSAPDNEPTPVRASSFREL